MMKKGIKVIVLFLCVISGGFGLNLHALQAAESNSPAGIFSPHSASLIIDHEAVALFDHIPKTYLEKAKALSIYYIHLSHGEQILSGMESLARKDMTYGLAVQFTSTPGLPLRKQPSVVRMYHENLGPESFWKSESGLLKTRAAARMGIFDLFLFSWCGEMSTYASDEVQEYLKAFDRLGTEFPNVRFIYMTGHVDGGSHTLRRNNDIIREYAKTNKKVLFDFADIESYDPGGKHHPSSGRQNGECSWCVQWCNAHPSDCSDIPASCGHSDASEPGGDASMAYICKVKAKAFWVMLARLSGWDGKKK